MRIRTVLGFAVLGIVSLACSGGDHPIGPPPPPVMCSYPGLQNLKASDPLCVPPSPSPTLDLSLNSPSGIVGDTVGGTANTTNSISCTLTAIGASLISGSNCGPFKAILTAVGTASITGTATGASGTQPASVTKNITVSPKPVITFAGKIILTNVQQGDTPGGWIVSVSVMGEEKVSTTSNGDGTYTLPPINAGATRSAVITLIPPTASRYFPEYLETTTGYVSVNMKWPAVPKCWVIEKGIYTNQCINVDLVQAMSEPLNPSSHFLTVERLFSVGNTELGFGYYIHPSWERVGFPVSIAFDRTSTTYPISSEDSVIFWNYASHINLETGRNLIIPSTEAEVRNNRKGILVYIDSTAQGTGGVGVFPQAIANPTDLVTNHSPLLGSIRIQLHQWWVDPNYATYFSRVVRHEIMHTLGLGHTDLWESLMSPVNDYFGPLTPKDVAYFEMMNEVALSQKDNFTLLGLAEALNGFYVITQGGSPTNKSLLP